MINKPFSKVVSPSRLYMAALCITAFAVVTPTCALAEDEKTPAASVTMTSGTPELYVTSDTIELGTQKEGPVTTFSVEVHNKGNALLKISNVRASCGCTNVAMDHNDIPPGELAHLNGGFNTQGHPGQQMKTITISSNDPKKANTLMTLRCQVIPANGASPTPMITRMTTGVRTFTAAPKKAMVTPKE